MPTLNWIGKEGETLDRHDRWLCMMYPRLALLREFLREDGSIWISLDDNIESDSKGRFSADTLEVDLFFRHVSFE